MERGLDASLAELRRLVAQPSISATGEGIGACAELCRELLAEHGFSAAVHATEGHPVVVGERGAGPRTLLLYCHYDTRPVGDPGEWTSPPFAAEIRDGRMYGRGCEDDKGHIVSRLAGIDAFVRAHGELPYRVVFVLDGEEEIGSPSLPAFVRARAEALRGDGCIWEWGTVDHRDRPVFMLGVRGMLDVELEIETANADAHSGLQSYLPNAAWRLTWALGTLKDASERVLIDGFYDRVRPATPAQAALLDALPDTEADEKTLYGVRDFAGGLSGDAWRRAVFAPTCTVNGLTSGFQGEGPAAVVPRRARAKLDFRLVPDQEPDEIADLLRRHLDAHGFADVRMRAGAGERAATVAPEDPFVAAVIASADAVYPEPPVVHPMAGGSGPLECVVHDLGTPVVIGVGIDRPGTLCHAPDEHVHVSDFVRGTQHMASVLGRLARLWDLT